MCDGMACVPGTIEKWKDVPCGINIITKDVSVCQSIRDTMGNAGSSFINKANTMCNCLPRILWLIKARIFDTIFTASGSLKVESDLVTEMVRLQTCFLDREFEIKDNRDEVYEKELTSQDGWVVFTAPEITLATYAELALAVSPCMTGVACSPVAVAAFFKRYVTSAMFTMGIQIGQLLLDWMKIFGTFKTKVSTITAAAKTIATAVTTIPAKVETTKKTVCQKQLCKGPGVTAFLNKVAKATTAAQSLQNIREAAEKATKAIPELISIVDKAIVLTKDVPDSKFFMDLVKSGAISKVDDMLESIQIARKLPESIQEIQDIIAPVQELVSKYENLAITVATAIKDVTSFSWTPYTKELQADSSGKLRGALTGVQNTVQLQLGESLGDLTAAMKDLRHALDTLPIKKTKIDYDTGVTYYKRWSSISVDAPCAKESKSNFEIGGFKTSYSYPSFYSCEYGPQDISWPPHFIPYLKIKLY
ncbi:hypothetical protein ACHAPT_011884 [Fusarium lateritium]